MGDDWRNKLFRSQIELSCRILNKLSWKLKYKVCLQTTIRNIPLFLSNTVIKSLHTDCRLQTTLLVKLAKTSSRLEVTVQSGLVVSWRHQVLIFALILHSWCPAGQMTCKAVMSFPQGQTVHGSSYLAYDWEKNISRLFIGWKIVLFECSSNQKNWNNFDPNLATLSSISIFHSSVQCEQWLIRSEHPDFS